jgi:hypothetical protein
VRDLAVLRDVYVGAPIDVLIHASLLVLCLQSGKDFCCEKTYEGGGAVSSITFAAPRAPFALANFTTAQTVGFYYAEDATGERNRARIPDRLGQQRAAVAAAVP